MKLLVCGVLLLIGLTTAKNTTKESTNVNKRYTIGVGQYNTLLYANNQVLPTQQLFAPNFLDNYIQTGVTPYAAGYYDWLSRYNYVPTYQQVVPQTQQVVPQQIVPQQILQQQVVPQQVVPQQVVPQQVVPQQVVPQQVIPQQIVPENELAIQQPILQQTLIPQQVLPQQIQAQQILPQQIIPQQLLQQPIIQQAALPQKVVPAYSPQQLLSLNQQQLPFQVTSRFPAQYQYYQPQSPKTPLFVNNQPYPYEVPPGQTKLPLTYNKQVPIPSRTVTIPLEQPVHIRLQQPASQAYSYPAVLQNVLYQVPDTANQQVVRIGYSHPSLHYTQLVQNTQPHTVYVNQNLLNTAGQQQVVRIGYGHPQYHHGHVDSGPQRINIPFSSDDGGGKSYQYGNGAGRTPRTPDGDEKVLK